jgi:5'-3' exoribonuclease 2
MVLQNEKTIYFAEGKNVRRIALLIDYRADVFVSIAEDRQDQNAKRRKIEAENSENGRSNGPSPALHLTTPTNIPSLPPSVHPSLPQKPSFDFASKADSIGFGAPPTAESRLNVPTATQALAGSNHDVVANRRAIRMANMSAAEMLKAELSGLSPVKPDLSLPPKPVAAILPPNPTLNFSNIIPAPMSSSHMSIDAQDESDEVPGLGMHAIVEVEKTDEAPVDDEQDAEGEPDPDMSIVSQNDGIEPLAGAKRKHDKVEGGAEDCLGSDEDDSEDDSAAKPKTLKVNPDGTVEQYDSIKYVNLLPYSY